MPTNLRRHELIAAAEATKKKFGGDVRVHYKFTCQHCGERVTINEPNVLPELGLCECGKYTPIGEGGYLLIVVADSVEEALTPKVAT